MIKQVSCIAAGVAAAISVASAQTSNSLGMASDPMIYNFDYATIGPLLTSWGYTHEAQQFDDGTYIRITDGNTIAVLHPRVCRGADGQTGCVGMTVEGYFRGAMAPGQVNAFNTTTPFATLEARGDSSVLERYIIADHGFSKKTLEVEMSVFHDLIVYFMDYRAQFATSVDFQEEAEAVSKLDNSLSAAPTSPAHTASDAAAMPGDVYNTGKAFDDLL